MSSSEPANPPSAAPAPPRLLVVDDDLINQKVMVNLLKRKGWEASAVANGRQCMELLQSRSFDLILLDIQMPEMDGYATAGHIREFETGTGRTPPTRIVALTTVAQPGTREKCLSCGMDEHLTKPVNTPALYATIERLLALPH